MTELAKPPYHATPSETEAQRFAREEGLSADGQLDKRPHIYGLAVRKRGWSRADLQERAYKSNVCGTFRDVCDWAVMLSKIGFKASTDFARAVCAKSPDSDVSVQRMLIYPAKESLWLQTWDPKAGNWTPPSPT